MRYGSFFDACLNKSYFMLLPSMKIAGNYGNA